MEWLLALLGNLLSTFSTPVVPWVAGGLSLLVTLLRTYVLPRVTGKAALYLTAAVALLSALLVAVGDSVLTGAEIVEAIRQALVIVGPAFSVAAIFYWLVGLLKKAKAAKVGA